MSLRDKNTPALLRPEPEPGLDALPETVLQFGEGNFLRGFIDWMLDVMIEGGQFAGRVVATAPTHRGSVVRLNDQRGAYTLLLRGLRGGAPVDEPRVIRAISRGINSYRDYPALLALARSEHLRFIVSNTTEAGISLDADDALDANPPRSFPGKVCAVLYHRWQHFQGEAKRGLIVLPTELIEANGQTLKQYVVELARRWQLEAGFIEWVETANHFCNTLVDRIVPGYPTDEAEVIGAQLGYEDRLLVVGEPFHFMAVEADGTVRRELPFDKAGLNVVYTDDLSPYRQRKVRLLNGPHTFMATAGFLAGCDTVRQCVEHPDVGRLVEQLMLEEIAPTLAAPAEATRAFAGQVLERFANPFIEHRLESIALNSVSKFRARLLPTMLDYHEKQGVWPATILRALAALFALYRPAETVDGHPHGRRGELLYPLRDDPAVLARFAALWQVSDPAAVARAALAERAWWGQDLSQHPGLPDAVAEALADVVAAAAVDKSAGT